MSRKPVLTEYSVSIPKLKDRIKIALIADIHERNIDDVFELIKGQSPDIIAVAGDTFERYRDDDNSGNTEKTGLVRLLFINLIYYTNVIIRFLFDRHNNPDTENSYRFLQKASALAPVYMSLGNHEEMLTDEDTAFLKKNGIHLLDNSDETVTVKDQTVHIGGLSPFRDDNWLKGFSEKSGLKILLCHHPEYYDDVIRDTGIDLVLSGHNHGGQIRLFGRGLVSSSTGLFPKYDRGIYENRLVVTAGSSNPVSVPRINNPREAVIVTLNTIE